MPEKIKTMTIYERVEKSLALWKWLNEHPLKRKKDSPFWEEIKDCFASCLLCDARSIVCYIGHRKCPLRRIGGCAGGAYIDWDEATTEEESASASAKIVTMLEDWLKKHRGR